MSGRINLDNMSEDFKSYIQDMNSQLEQKASTRQYGDKNEIVDHTDILKSTFSSGKSVILDNKEYYVSDKLTFRSNSTIDGNKAIIKPMSNISKGDNISAMYSNRNINMSNLTFEGTIGVGDDIDGVHMFDVWDSINININNCDFKNNTYTGSRYFNCDNVKINNCNYENVDCGIITLGDTANNFFISNCFFKGHYMSEPIAFYSDKLMKNINIDNCVMEDKSTNAILLGRENGNLESIVDGFSISNIITKNTTGGIYFSQCKNGTVNNVTFQKGENYGFTMFSFNYAENINVSNCICEGSNYHSIIIKNNSKNINISNTTIIEPGGGNGKESESRFVELYGSDCTLDNIKCISNTNLCDKNIYVYGNNNKLTNIIGKKYASENMNIFLEPNSNNNVIINPIGFNVYDRTLNYTTATTNRVRRDDWAVGSTPLSSLNYQVYNKFFIINYSYPSWPIVKLSLYAEGESIRYIIQNKYYTDMSLTLGGDDSNIIFKNNDTITLKTGELIEFEFIVRGNMWVEISR